MKKEHQEFLELFHPQPGYKVMEVTTHANDLTQMLAESIVPYNGRFAVALYPGEHDGLETSEYVKIHSVPDFTKPFRALPRDNDIVILSDMLYEHTYPERILKACYTTLANTGEIIIIARKGSLDFERLFADLEATEYRAANKIDIFEAYDLVMAKKMHMWGNGL